MYMYLPGLLSLICIAAAFILPFAKGALPAPIAFLSAAILVIAQVLLGLFAIRRRRKAGSGQGSRSFGPLLCGAGGVMLWAIALPALQARVMTGVNRQPCPSNLSRIGIAIFLYASEHNGAYPTSLDLLVEELELDPRALVCPSSEDRVAQGATAHEIATQIKRGGHCSYLYFGAGLTGKVTAEMIVACDQWGNHSEGVNILFGDGHVCWVRGLEAKRLLDEVNSGHNPPRPPTWP